MDEPIDPPIAIICRWRLLSFLTSAVRAVWTAARRSLYTPCVVVLKLSGEGLLARRKLSNQLLGPVSRVSTGESGANDRGVGGSEWPPPILSTRGRSSVVESMVVTWYRECEVMKLHPVMVVGGVPRLCFESHRAAGEEAKLSSLCAGAEPRNTARTGNYMLGVNRL